MILVTGGAGFIGANFILDWLAEVGEPVLNVDRLTYAGNLGNLASIRDDARHVFARADIGDRASMVRLLEMHRPRAIVNFAAETHVDRSIHGPAAFVETNVVATFALLDVVREYCAALDAGERGRFRFLHVSTDEVFGSLAPDARGFCETTAYAPNSPYSASKAAADHLVRAYHHTYGLPVLTTNCSNNYGPRQFPEKLIPLMIHNALGGKPLPVYGDGGNVRDWLYVSDHCAAIRAVLERGTAGETYNVGGGAERTNLDVVQALCAILARLRPGRDYRSQITFVNDRPGHDRRYAIDAGKIARELGWTPRESFESGLERTVRWYLDNAAWLAAVTSGEYHKWVSLNYATAAA
ncbi:MAG: dTDP-glucose 4,6-dehydratase [Betaproteobacteria bacterium]